MVRSDIHNKLLKKTSLFLVLSFCMVSNVRAQVFPVETILNNGLNSNRVNLVYLSDGYTEAQLGTFITNTNSINDGMFLQTPFTQYKSFFNAYAVKVPSLESGAKHPGTASDEGASGGQPIANPNTYFNTTFDYADIHRLVVPQNGTAINNVLAANTPDYDQAFVVVNSSYYGGSGGAYATSTTHNASIEVSIHEIGHSFANLADEYAIGGQGEKPNRTTNTNPLTIKWKNWLGINNIGIYPIGVGGYQRPHQNCKMQFLNSPFCSVCTEAFIDRIHQLVNMIDTYSPSTLSFTLTNANDVNFSMTHIPTTPSTITVNWYLNENPAPFATNVPNVSIPFNTFIIGPNTVRVEVVDNTTLSKTYLPGVGYVNNLTWAVTKPISLDVNLLNFTGSVNVKNEGILDWEIASTDDLRHFELEKSTDGKTFSLLSKVDKIEDRNDYSYKDESLTDPVSYYRLKILDKDGSSKYSNIISLRIGIEKFSYKVYQDALNQLYSLNLRLNEPEKVSATVSDAAGRPVWSKDYGTITGNFNYDIDLKNNTAGIYFLVLQIGSSRYNVKLLAE